MRQRCAVHLVGDDCRLIDRLPDRDALDEVWRLVDRGAVGAIEHDFDRLFFQTGLVEHVLESGAFPARATHGAVAPFNALHVRL